MRQISRDEFYDLNANHMAGVSADNREFYRIDDETIGVLAVDRGDDVRVRGTVQRLSNGRYGNDGSKFETARNEDGVERSREKVENWLQNQ